MSPRSPSAHGSHGASNLVVLLAMMGLACTTYALGLSRSDHSPARQGTAIEDAQQVVLANAGGYGAAVREHRQGIDVRLFGSTWHPVFTGESAPQHHRQPHGDLAPIAALVGPQFHARMIEERKSPQRRCYLVLDRDLVLWSFAFIEGNLDSYTPLMETRFMGDLGIDFTRHSQHRSPPTE
ncbi:MAG: hypothetical protein EA401_13185 [Planctomycetota bacterium]|nr:MAG: hypothetical protein EA401_13185 [Planctomycetota bacterium]